MSEATKPEPIKLGVLRGELIILEYQLQEQAKQCEELAQRFKAMALNVGEVKRRAQHKVITRE